MGEKWYQMRSSNSSTTELISKVPKMKIIKLLNVNNFKFSQQFIVYFRSHNFDIFFLCHVFDTYFCSYNFYLFIYLCHIHIIFSCHVIFFYHILIIFFIFIHFFSLICIYMGIGCLRWPKSGLRLSPEVIE